MNNKTTKYIELMQLAEQATSRKEAKHLINRATELREQLGIEYKYAYSGLN